MSTNLAEPISRPWRGFLRFSVRALIALVLVAGAGIGWTVGSARNQRDAVAAIKNAGGVVGYGRTLDLEPITWAPRWLVDRIGVHYFSRVTAVAIDEFTTTVEINAPPVGDLASFQQLRTRKPVSPEQVLARLKHLPDLSILHLNGHQVTDDKLVHLKDLTNLSTLVMVSTQITGPGLVHLKALPRLSRLSIHDTQLADDGLANLKNLTSLSYLSLAYTPVSDAGLTHLKGLTNLGELDLQNTRVTDAGVVQLKVLRKLTRLKLSDTPVTDAGVKKLTQSLPSVYIVR